MRSAWLGILLLAGLSAAAQGLAVYTTLEEIPESNPVRRIHARGEGVQFSFVAPAGWSHRVAAEGKAVTAQKGELAAVTITPIGGGRPAKGSLAAKVKAEHPEIGPVEEYSAPSGGREPGLGVEFTQSLGGKAFLTRIHTYTSSAGIVEVRLLARADAYETIHHEWTTLINTFRVAD